MFFYYKMYIPMYLVKNDINKMILLNEDLQVLSDEYDKILTIMSIDISPNFSSYYQIK